MIFNDFLFEFTFDALSKWEARSEILNMTCAGMCYKIVHRFDEYSGSYMPEASYEEPTVY